MFFIKIFSNLSVKFNLILQISLREFVKFLFSLEHLKKKLPSDHFGLFLSNYVNLNLPNQLKSLNFFLRKIFFCKYFLSNFFNWNWINFFNFHLILEKWKKAIAFCRIYEIFKKVYKHSSVKKLHSVRNKHKLVKYQITISSFLKIKQFISGLFIRKWISFKKKNTNSISAYVKKDLHKNSYLNWQKLKINKILTSFYLKNLQVKKMLLIDKWDIRFESVYTNILTVKFLQNFIEYIGIKVYKAIFNDLGLIFFNFFILNHNHLVSKKKNFKKTALFSNLHQFGIFIFKYSNNQTHFSNFDSFVFFCKYFKKNTNFQPNTKIHRYFLTFYEKISLILIHVKKLKIRLNNVFFFRKKSNENLFLNRYLGNSFFLKNKFSFFLTKFDQMIWEEMELFESYFYKFFKKKRISTNFFEKCKSFIRNFYKKFFSSNQFVHIFDLSVRIFFHAYSFKNFLIRLNYEQFFHIIGKKYSSKIPSISVGDFFYFLDCKINNYKNILERMTCIVVLSSSFFNFQKVKKITNWYTIEFLYLEKFFI